MYSVIIEDQALLSHLSLTCKEPQECLVVKDGKSLEVGSIITRKCHECEKCLKVKIYKMYIVVDDKTL